jgi:RNA polymerase sigma-70 factor, ECF subfamily
MTAAGGERGATGAMNAGDPSGHPSGQPMFLETVSPAGPMVAAERVADPLVERCRSGDAAAWRALSERHFDFAYRTARRLGLPEGDGEDAVQEAFAVAFQRLGQFQGGRFSTWLFRIVANVVSAKLRRRRVRDFFSGLLSVAGEELGPSPEGQLEARRTLVEVQAILRALPREKREVFALHELEGLTHEEIAELVGAKVETVRTRLFYARREFERRARRLRAEP